MTGIGVRGGPDPDALASAIESLAVRGAAAVPVIGAEACDQLTEAAADLEFRPARPTVGEGPKSVHQDFDICTGVPEDGPFGALSDALSTEIEMAVRSIANPPLTLPFRFNDRVLQRYAVGARGISPHRDHIRYQGLVAIVVISGDGRFYVCADRSGRGSLEVPASAGHVILMRAPGFAGERDRPFHGLDGVRRQRLSLGLRHDVQGPDGTVA